MGLNGRTRWTLKNYLIQKLKLIDFGLNFLFKYVTFLFTFQYEIIFAHKYPTISLFMCEYTSIIIHESLGPSTDFGDPLDSTLPWTTTWAPIPY